MNQRRSSRDEAFLALNLGELNFPGSFAKYLLTKKEPGAKELTGLIQTLNYDTLGLGSADFGLDIHTQLPFLKESTRRQLPYQASNIRCTNQGGAEALCDLIGTGKQKRGFQIVKKGPVRIALLSVFDPAHTNHIAKSHLTGLSVGSFEETLRKQVRQIRKDRLAEVILVHMHIRDIESERKLRKFAAQEQGIDLIITNQAVGFAPEDRKKQESNFAGFMKLPVTGTLWVHTGRGIRESLVVRLALSRQNSDSARWKIVPERIERKFWDTGKTDDVLHKELIRVEKEFCSAWGSSIHERHGTLQKEIGRKTFEGMVLDVMREEGSAEISILNRGVFRNLDQLPLTDHMTKADIHALLPYQTQLFAARIRGDKLLKLWKRRGEKLLVRGVDGSIKKLKINGRVLEKRRYYTVITSRFVADGGDELLDPGWLQDKKRVIGESAREETLQGIFIEAMKRKGPSTEDLDLHQKFLWSWSSALLVSYKNVQIANPVVGGNPRYTQPQFTLTPTDQINFEANVRLDADQRDHKIGTQFLFQYAATRISDDDEETQEPFEESSDNIQAQLSYAYAGFRVSNNAWYVPLPLAEVQLLSELNPPEERSWHRFQATGILGSKFRFHPKVSIKAGVNIRREILEPNAQSTWGLHLGYDIKKTNISNILGRPFYLESEADIFLNNIGLQNIIDVRSQHRVYYAFTERFFFTTTYNLYAYREDPVPDWGIASEFLLGINYLLETTAQTFD